MTRYIRNSRLNSSRSSAVPPSERETGRGHKNTVGRLDRRLKRSLRGVVGSICWGIESSRLTNLSMNFGEPRLRILREPCKSKSRVEECSSDERRRLITVRGQWWVWVYVAYWRILRAGRTRASTSSSNRHTAEALRSLDGQRLIDVEVGATTMSTTFVFDLDTILEVRRRAPNDDEIWLLYEPDGYVLSVRGDGTFDREPASGVDARPRLDHMPAFPAGEDLPETPRLLRRGKSTGRLLKRDLIPKRPGPKAKNPKQR